MSRRKRKNEKLQRRVRQMKLPTEHVRKPRGGDWSHREAHARRELERARQAAGL